MTIHGLEPLLQNTSNKYTIFPINNISIWESYLNHKKCIWFDDEVDISGDNNDWKKLNENEKFFIKHILAFFASSDGIIMENLAANFLNEVQMAEARAFYSLQMFMENIHSVMYSKLIETYVSNTNEKIKLFNAVESMPAIKSKAEWAKRWISSDSRFAMRLVAFTIVEGLFFSGAFCSIYWLSERGLMPGLCMSNEFIARDEKLHVEFGALLYTKHVVNKLSQDEINELITDAVRIEKEFITESLPVSLLGMNSNMMMQYIEYVAGRLITILGHKSPYENIKNPFPFMDRISLQNQTNFFDTRVSEYQRTVNSSHIDENFDEINFDTDF